MTTLLLMLSPHLLCAQLIVVVHRTSAVRTLHILLLIVHLRRVDAVATIGICVCIVVLLMTIHASVRRLPPHRICQVRAVVATTILLLAVSRSRLENLRWVVAGGWI